MDLNWNSHPFQVSNAGYTPQMIATMREMLAFYEGTMFWAQDWDSPKDAMHHQMGYDTYGSPKLNDFIKRKIRADGYSTFRRGGAAPAPTPADADTELTKLFASRSPYRTDDKPFETLAGFILGIDRMVHQQLVEGAALRGERWAVDLVRKVAAGDVNHAGTWLWYPDSVGRRQKDLWAIAHAKAVLAQIEA